MERKIVSIRLKIIKIVKKILGIHLNQSLSLSIYLRNKRLKYGPYIWKKKFKVPELLEVMQSLGLQKGSNVFIQCNWNEFYNFLGTEKDLINGILEIIGEDGTLMMPAFPLLRKGKIFNLKKSVTGAGLLAECFRNYPGVKRSVNVQHSVCAIGPISDYMLSEHHNSDTCWDEKSPYYKLAETKTLVFIFGLGKYSLGTMIHCVESVLRKEVPYFQDFFDSEKTVYQYVDIDDSIKEYSCYNLRKNLNRVNKFGRSRFFCKKYFDDTYHKYAQISNLEISASKAEKVIPRLIELGRKGIIFYKKPSTKGYIFKK